MDEQPKDEKMHAPSFSEIAESVWTKGVARLAMVAAIPMLGVLIWMGETGVTSIIDALKSHNAAIASIQATVSAIEKTNISNHWELKDFRKEAEERNKVMSNRVEAIERDSKELAARLKEMEPRVKDIETRVKAQ